MRLSMLERVLAQYSQLLMEELDLASAKTLMVDSELATLLELATLELPLEKFEKSWIMRKALEIVLPSAKAFGSVKILRLNLVSVWKLDSELMRAFLHGRY